MDDARRADMLKRMLARLKGEAPKPSKVAPAPVQKVEAGAATAPALGPVPAPPARLDPVAHKLKLLRAMLQRIQE